MFIKHKDFTDVCIEVQSMRKELDGTAIIHGSFWTTIPALYSVGERLKIKISKDRFTQWLMSNSTTNTGLVWEEWSY